MKSREDVVVGIDTFPETLLKLFRGENFGKLVLQVAAGLSAWRRRPRRSAGLGMTDAAHEPGLAALPAELLQAFVAQSRDMLALTDATGTLLWANARFAAATGLRRPRRRRRCSISRSRAPPAREARLSFARMLSCPRRRQRRAPAARPGAASRSGSTCTRRASPAASSGRFADVTRQRSLAATRRAPGRAARHRAGVRPARHLGARDPVGRRALGQARVRLLGHRPGRRHAELQRRDRAHPPRRSRPHDVRRVDAARRPLRAALPRHPSRRQDALDPLAVGSEERPARRARPRPRRHDGRHRGLRRGAHAERRQRAAQARRRPRQDRDLAPRPAHRPHALQRPRVRAARHGAAAGRAVDRRGALVHPSRRHPARRSPRPSRRSRRASRPTWRRATGAPTAAGATC